MLILEQIFELRENQPPEVTDAEVLLEEPRNQPCGRFTKAGAPCKHQRKPSQAACGQHASHEETRAYEEQLVAARELREAYWSQLEPCCWHWPITEDDRARVATAEDPMQAIYDWQAGRCAVCGGSNERRDFVLDHDHYTGLSRGWLCWMCNRAEGAGRKREYEKYRHQHPASMFGVRDVYEGPWWNPRDLRRDRSWIEEEFGAS
jgi:hypothetical protein